MEPDDPKVDALVDAVVGRIAHNLDRVAAQKGWSLRKVSRVTGVNSQSIHNIRNAKANPTMRTIVLLAEGLGVDVVDLLRVSKREG